MGARPSHRPENAQEDLAVQEASATLGPLLLYRVTATGLTKNYIDVRRENFPRLKTMGLHDYESDPDGRTSTTRAIILVESPDASSVSEIRWYTVTNKRKDARFRISRLASLVRPDDLLAIGMADGVVVASNMSARTGASIHGPDATAEIVPLEGHEGRMTERLHRARERDRTIVDARKAAARAAHGALICETCGFTPVDLFGSAGERAIEAHHLRPLASLPADGTVTKTTDLALLCATCHRLIHALGIQMDELQGLHGYEGLA